MTSVDDRLRLLFARGVVRHADVVKGLAAAQAEFLKGETRRVEMPQGYGFAAALKPGAEVFAAFATGERSAGIAIANDDRRYRPDDLKAGEVILYGQAAKELPYQWIRCTDDPKPGTIKIRARRIEMRAGDYYSVLDADTGPHSGTHPMSDPNLPV